MAKKTIISLPLMVLVILSLITFVLPESSTSNGDENHRQVAGKLVYQTIGYSHLGTAIKSCTITPPDYNKTMLLTFAMHGYEDSWAQDGIALVQIAEDVIAAFADNPQELQQTRLIVIPCVNPDGLSAGQSSNGFGRCNAQGIDINRDFDYHWSYCGINMYRTGAAPFATPEARALRDLVLAEHVDIVIDFHGWLNCSLGDEGITDCFNQAFASERQKPYTYDNTYMAQFFAGWAGQYARSALLEYPDPQSLQNMLDLQYSQKTIDFLKCYLGKL